MDELDLFFKALPDKVFVEKSRKCKGGKKARQRLTADTSKVGEAVVIWKSHSTKCFKNFQRKTQLRRVHYFTNETAWMNSEIMGMILKKTRSNNEV